MALLYSRNNNDLSLRDRWRIKIFVACRAMTRAVSTYRAYPPWHNATTRYRMALNDRRRVSLLPAVSVSGAKTQTRDVVSATTGRVVVVVDHQHHHAERCSDHEQYRRNCGRYGLIFARRYHQRKSWATTVYSPRFWAACADPLVLLSTVDLLLLGLFVIHNIFGIGYVRITIREI